MSDLELIKDTDLPCPLPTNLESSSDEDTRRIYERQQADDQHELAQQSIKDRKRDRKMRVDYANKIHCLVCWWLFILFLLLLLQGYGATQFSDSVLIAILTGTTIDILGLMVIVANYLFPKNGKK